MESHVEATQAIETRPSVPGAAEEPNAPQQPRVRDQLAPKNTGSVWAAIGHSVADGINTLGFIILSPIILIGMICATAASARSR